MILVVEKLGVRDIYTGLYIKQDYNSSICISIAHLSMSNYDRSVSGISSASSVVSHQEFA